MGLGMGLGVRGSGSGWRLGFSGAPLHVQLLRSTWRRGEPLLIEAEGHGYLDGAQHEKRPEERSRASS